VTVGDLFVRDLPGGSIVRVAIGLRHAGGFEPIAHGASLEMPTGAPWPIVAEILLGWTPEGAALPSKEGRVAPEAAVGFARGDVAPAEHPRPAPSVSLGASESWLAEGPRTSE
jgi:hypothetical protein